MGLEQTVPQTSLLSMAVQHPKCVMAGKETGSEQCISPTVHCVWRGAQISTQTHTGIAACYVCADIETQTIQALSAVHSWGCLLSIPFNEALYINEGPEECCAQSCSAEQTSEVSPLPYPCPRSLSSPILDSPYASSSSTPKGSVGS